MGCGAFPRALLLIVPPRCFIPSVPQRLLQSLSLPLVIYRWGEVSVPWRIWTVPADFPLERGSSPFVFQSGLRTRSAGCQLDSRHPGPLPYSLSHSSLLFPSPPALPSSFPPPFSPSVMEKQVRFSRFTERGAGPGSSRTASNNCFSNSPPCGNSSAG